MLEKVIGVSNHITGFRIPESQLTNSLLRMYDSSLILLSTRKRFKVRFYDERRCERLLSDASEKYTPVLRVPDFAFVAVLQLPRYGFAFP